MKARKRVGRRQLDIEAAGAYLASRTPRTRREIDYHASIVEAGASATEAELGLGISFQAIGVALMAVLVAIAESSDVTKMIVGGAALFALVLGGVIALSAFHDAYLRRATLRDLYAARRDFREPTPPRKKRLFG